MANTNMIVARFGEIFLKSKPVRKRFISQLINNIQTAVDGEVSRKRLRILIYPENEEKALEELRKVFGLVSISPAKETEPDIDKVKEIAKEESKDWEGTFAVKAQRISKDYSFTSKDVEEEVGAVIQEETGLEVDLDDPDNIFYAEFYGEDAYTFTEKVESPGGLPLGVSGTLEAKIEDEDDLIACWMMMKRGCIIRPLNKNSMQKKLRDRFEEWHLTDKKPDKESIGIFIGEKDPIEASGRSEGRETPVYAPLTGLNPSELRELKEKVFS